MTKKELTKIKALQEDLYQHFKPIRQKRQKLKKQLEDDEDYDMCECGGELTGILVGDETAKRCKDCGGVFNN